MTADDAAFRLGAHVSISGGIQKAVERETEVGGNCGQIFVGSPRGWAVSDIDDEEAEQFREASDERDIGPWVVHGTYLINLATPDDELAEKSVEAVQAELDATAKLEIPYYVFHPGSHTGIGVEAGVQNVGERLSKLDIPENVTLLLENTAGKGTSVGRRLQELDGMVSAAEYTYGDVGVCLDTCHLLAGGYDITSDEGLRNLLADIEEFVGRENIQYLHLNDSKHPLDSRQDEHEHVGKGEIGKEGFRRFINHERLRDKPMVLETPENEKGFEWNIERVRDLRD